MLYVYRLVDGVYCQHEEKYYIRKANFVVALPYAYEAHRRQRNGLVRSIKWAIRKWCLFL